MRCASFIAVVGFALFLAPSASAQPPSSSLVDIRPAGSTATSFALTLAPGEHRDLAVDLINADISARRVDTFAADTYTLVNGGFGVRLASDPRSAEVRWLGYPDASITLAAGESVTRPLTVDVPTNAAPGEYIASVVVQSADPPPASPGGVAINQVVRHALAVDITVPGPRTPGFAIGNAHLVHVGGGSVISVEVNNTGNVRIRPRGQIIVRQSDGSVDVDAAVSMDAVFAGDSTTFEVSLPRVLNARGETVDVTLADSATGTHVQATRALDLAAQPHAPATAPDGSDLSFGDDHGTAAMWIGIGAVVLVITIVVRARRRARWRHLASVDR